MKSYFLERLSDEDALKQVLCEVLPGQSDPWLVTAANGDAVAYFYIAPFREIDKREGRLRENPGVFVIQADISGRHYNEDDVVLNVLSQLQKQLGGEIRDDYDNILWIQ